MKKLLALLYLHLVCSAALLANPAPSSTLKNETQSPTYKVIEDKATYPLLNPALADRQSSKLQLENGLEIYLISDPGTKQSAAGICIEAGSWNDPKEFPGMAHFLEHMLFMGTKAYPSEFEYMRYIADHGGLVNASTWPDRTIYMFSVNNDAFSGALDRFSHFFIDPLFLTSCIQRELHAVDQEHAKNIEHDGWRQYMVFKETGNPLHPNSAFSTGNAQTLGHIPQEALITWYNNHYSSEKMHLVILSCLPLNELTALVAETFVQVPKRSFVDRPVPEQISSAKQRGHMIYLKPVKDLRALSFIWELPSSFSGVEKRSMASLIAYALGNEAKGSLIQELKNEKLAESLHTGCDTQSKDKLLFTIDINLTTQGVTQTDTVIAHVFQALARLKKSGIPYYLFNEMQEMAVLGYQYQSREDAFDFISTHAHDILDESLSTYPEKTRIPSNYDLPFLTQLLQQLTPENCIFFLQAELERVGVQPDKREKWMKAEYAIKEIPQEKLAIWAKQQPTPQITLPPPNPFLPDLSNIALGKEIDESPIIPTLLEDDRWGKIYHAPDNRYLVPEVFASFALRTQELDGSPKSIVLFDCYKKSLNEKLSSTLWFASTAGLNVSLGVQDLKFLIHLHGYQNKAALLLQEIFQSLKMVHPSKEQFDIYKQTLLSTYENASKELPVIQSRELLDSILYNDTPTAGEKLQVLKSLSYEEFISFLKTLFKSCFIEGLIYGNIETKTIKQLWAEIKNALACEPLSPSSLKKKQLLMLPEKRGPSLISQSTPRQGNGVVLALQEGSLTFEKRAAQEILGITLQDAFFDTLRTKQQTGYIAKAWPIEKERQLMQFFAVQSSTHHPMDLLSRFELFLENFVKSFPEILSEERFEEIRAMVITTLQMPPENLATMGQKLNKFAFEYDDFYWIDKRIDAVKNLSYEKIKFFAHEFFSRHNLRRIAILTEGVLPKENDFRYELTSKEDICGLGMYISSN